MAQVLFTRLKANWPTATLTVLAPAWSLALLERMPEVDATLVLPFVHGEAALRERWRLGATLRAHGFDWAIILPNSWKSALILTASGIARRTGWVGEFRYGLLNDIRKLDKQQLPLMIQRFAALAEPAITLNDLELIQARLSQDCLPRPKLVVDLVNRQQCIARFKLSLDQRILALCPGAEFGVTKLWPAEYYAKTALAYLEQGWQVWLFGSPNDQATGEALVAAVQAEMTNSQALHNFIGQTKLGDAVDLMSLAQAVVSNDSGLMHIAAALDLHLVAVYGSTSPEFTPPLGERTKILQKSLYCSPCFARVCKEQHLKCLRDITPNIVLEHLPTVSSATDTTP